MNTKSLLEIVFIVFLTWNCSSGVQPDKMHTLREIKSKARNGQIVKSQGIVIEKTGKRDFMVTDYHVTMIINLGAFKKESKILEKNSKIEFSGTYRNTIFGQPEIEVSYLQIVEEFK
jgi:uncharacterized protein YdeI (BOF family)